MDGHAHVVGMAGSEGRKITRTCCLATFAAAFSREDSDAYSLALAMYPCATSWSWIAPAFSRSASACHRRAVPCVNTSPGALVYPRNREG
jgi:hypothetical protein